MVKLGKILMIKSNIQAYRFELLKNWVDRFEIAISLLRPDKESYDAFQITSTLFCMNGT